MLGAQARQWANGTSNQRPAARRTGRREGVSPVALGLRLLGAGPMLILVLLVLAISLWTPNFLKPGNLANIAAQTAVIAIVAMGQQLVILTRGIDLSVGLQPRTLHGHRARWSSRRSNSAPLVILAMLATGTLVGLINGVVYVYRAPAASIYHHAGDA